MTSQHPTALVTGGANGIGLACAEALASEGYRVTILDSDKDALDQLKNFKTVCGNVADEKIIQHALDVAAPDGCLDVIVSNAGIADFKPLTETSLEDWNRLLAINLTPAFLLAKLGEKVLRKACGRMVLIASTRAHMSEPGTFAYSATKGGIVSLTHELAISLGPEIRVNCISPGWINVSGENLSEEDHQQHPAGRVGTPEDIARAMVYLTDPNNDFVTGTEIIVDGGMTRKMIYT